MKIPRLLAIPREETEDEAFKRRIKFSENNKYHAREYRVLYRFIDETPITNDYNFITEDYMTKLFALAFTYIPRSKHQNTVVEIENMTNSERFGIWRRYAFKRVIDSNEKKLLNVFKRFGKKPFETFTDEIRQMNERSSKLYEFYKKLPEKEEHYRLFGEIIPVEKFLTDEEKEELPKQEKGTIQFKKKKLFLDMYTKMMYKLHHNEPDLSWLFDIVKKHQEKSLNRLLFYKNFLSKPVTIEEFNKRNHDSGRELI